MPIMGGGSRAGREFFRGAGARREVRTVFAVGDVKQSIFSFQRADPSAFQAMRDYFSLAPARRAALGHVPLKISFARPRRADRDHRVFATPAAADASARGRPIVPPPVPRRAGRAGRAVAAGGTTAAHRPAAWAPPVRRVAGVFAVGEAGQADRRRIAAMIGGRPAAGPRSPGARRRLPVLVRRRTSFVEEGDPRAKQRGVPVAGVDRMVLTDQVR